MVNAKTLINGEDITDTVLLGNPTTDPEIASSCINLAAKMIPSYLDIFLYPQSFDSIPLLFTFAIDCLTAAEIMPKRAASQFWVSTKLSDARRLL